MSIILRAALLGLATGGRSTAGLTALAVTVTSSRGGSPLTNPWTGRAAVVAGLGEAVVDKLPQTPSRLRPVVLGPRLAFGAVSGAILAHRAGGGRATSVLAATAGLAGAAAGSWLGVSWRGRASSRFGADLPGALIEDAVVLGTAKLALG